MQNLQATTGGAQFDVNSYLYWMVTHKNLILSNWSMNLKSFNAFDSTSCWSSWKNTWGYYRQQTELWKSNLKNRVEKASQK